MRSPGSNRLLQFSVVLFAIGLIALIALFVTPIVDDGQTAPTLVYVLTMCAPLGFVIAVISTVVSGRTPKSTDRK
ncbi:hypothetical protein HH308_09990 [Gordonia sp. TBRC 11910]|uniref:Uncharacterized protein n=1 Tax=Gordonia asplenii TaxID=2725283 RepID=A0A848KTF6_9ACTN|nr:hypothetical protein [Gordonia asplenii]NMO01542.1 hypothetical protein [Gordonia asplenii]